MLFTLQPCQCNLFQFGSVSELFSVASDIEVPWSNPSVQEDKNIKVVAEFVKFIT